MTVAPSMGLLGPAVLDERSEEGQPSSGLVNKPWCWKLVGSLNLIQVHFFGG